MRLQKHKMSMINSILNTIWCYSNKHINFKMGYLSGLITGSIVFAININHGFWPAFASFLKQFVFNLFMAGYNSKTCEKLVNRIENKFLAYSAASIIPTLQAFIVLFAIHYYGGTPKPAASTLWQVACNLVFFFALAMVYGGDHNIRKSSFFQLTKIFNIRTYLKSRKVQSYQSIKKQAS